MKIAKLEEMYKGWFIGAFEPTLYATTDCEVAVKQYKEGDYEESHYHKVATEYTVIINGRVCMNGIEYTQGDIIIIEPYESTDFKVLSKYATTVVVKIPGASNDKYQGGII